MNLEATRAADLPRIHVILASTRQGRFGEKVAAWFFGIAAARTDLAAELVDLRDWPLPFFDEPAPPITGRYAAAARPWADKVGEADGFVIVTPEYNWGYPAVLKNALDHVFHEWNYKPMAFVSYGGPAGGSRSVQQLRQVVVELEMVPVRADIIFPGVWRLFGEDGTPTDKGYDQRAAKLLDKMAWWSRVLKQARATPPPAS